jgi:hypothetical protein
MVVSDLGHGTGAPGFIEILQHLDSAHRGFDDIYFHGLP